MKTGFDVLDTHSFDESQLDFLRKVVAIMKILSKEALQTALGIGTTVAGIYKGFGEADRAFRGLPDS